MLAWPSMELANTCKREQRPRHDIDKVECFPQSRRYCVKLTPASTGVLWPGGLGFASFLGGCLVEPLTILEAWRYDGAPSRNFGIDQNQTGVIYGGEVRLLSA
ncbi:hypothetical protein BKA80DRAFT_299974 [Phyllosticta citrichinensis]